MASIRDNSLQCNPTVVERNELTESCVEVKPIYPSRNKPFSEFVKGEFLPKTTFHKVQKVTHINSDKKEFRSFFFKENLPNSLVSELEAVIASFYKLIAPHHTPNTYAIYDDKKNQYIGVVSEEFPEFKSIALDPLTEEDIKTDFFDQKNLPIEFMDLLDNELLCLEEENEKIKRKFLYFTAIENTLINELEKTFDPEKINDYKKLFLANSDRKNSTFLERCISTEKIHFYCERIKNNNGITKEHL